jgi:hypothetical protein
MASVCSFLMMTPFHLSRVQANASLDKGYLVLTVLLRYYKAPIRTESGRVSHSRIRSWINAQLWFFSKNADSCDGFL